MNTLRFFLLLLMNIFCTTNTIAQNPLVEEEKPNIIIILADDLGYGDVGYNGANIQTPNIDWLAANGLVFTRFYAHTSCTPSRVGLMSGRFAAREGLANGVITPKCGDGLDPNLFILPEMLASAGYQNRSCIGKWHLGHSNIKYHPLQQGFSHFYGHYGGMIDYFTHQRAGEVDWHRNYDNCTDEGYATDLITKEAIKQIENWSQQANPFFLYLAYNAPHMPLQAKVEDLEQYGYKPENALYKLPNDSNTKDKQEGRGNTTRQTYRAMVHALDKGIGNIIQALQVSGAINNTIIIFYSDNGGNEKEGANNGRLRGGKGNFYEGGVRVPAVIYYPKKIKSKRTIEHISSHVDLFPTLMELANADKANLIQPLDGESLVPLFDEKVSINKDYKRIIYLSQTALVTQKWKLYGKQLFNLSNDTGEKTNVAKKHPATFNMLNEKLKQLSKEIENPIKRNFNYKILPNWEMPK